MQKDWKSQVKQAWHWLWHDDSVLSWVVSIAVAFLIIKFLIYPALGLIFGTQFPVVAVVSDSMEHPEPFDDWWSKHEDMYLRYNITKNQFNEFPMKRGFNKGDIIILFGVKPEKINRGDIIVYWGGKAYPIIHRVIAVDYDSERYFQTKGDNNLGQIINPPYLDERRIPATQPCPDELTEDCSVILGKAAFRVPYLGWVKIGAVEFLGLLGLKLF